MSSPGLRFPDAALDWLAGGYADQRVLCLSPNSGLPRRLAGQGQHVWCIDRRVHRLAPLSYLPGIVTLAARPEQMPFESCQFDVALAHQCLHNYDPHSAYSEIARVLRPGGWVAASYLVRDNSVPWVRRFIALMRTVDPSAMSADTGASAIETLSNSKYFPRVERRDFRIWVPVSRAELIDMTARQRAVAAMGEHERARLLKTVSSIYDNASAGSELRLPYQLSCARAYVDHAEMTTPIQLHDDALIIPL